MSLAPKRPNATRRAPRAILRILITAGPTREYIDTVRYISNDSSGKMGLALAAAAIARGHAVTLVHGPVERSLPPGAHAVGVVSAAEMLTACKKLWPGCDVLIMAAAVADYAPARSARSKRKKTAGAWRLAMQPTVDVLATLAARRRPDQTVIGFALEDRAARKNAAAKLERKQLDAIVLNRPSAIGADRSAIEVLVRGGTWRSMPKADKGRHAIDVIVLAEQMHAQRASKRTSGLRVGAARKTLPRSGTFPPRS